VSASSQLRQSVRPEQSGLGAAAQNLIAQAVDQRDYAIAVLDGSSPASPRIVLGTPAFERLFGRIPLSGQILAELRAPGYSEAVWKKLLNALQQCGEFDGELECISISGAPIWFGFALSHVVDPSDGRPYSVILGRDITARRRARIEQAGIQQLLAAVFMKLEAACAIVREDGRVFIGNDAFQRLIGYSADELTGLHVSRLTHPDDIEPAKAAHARQLSGGATYHMRIRTIRKDRTIIPVQLASVRVENSAGHRMRVVTLMPELDSIDGLAETTSSAGVSRTPRIAPTGPVGNVQVISLQALRRGFGGAWEKMSDRMLLLAESIIKRRIGPADVFARADDQSFVIWFADGDAAANAQCIQSLVREIRIKLLVTLGEKAAKHVSAVVIDGADGATKPGQTSAALMQNFEDARNQADQQARQLAAKLQTTVPTVSRVVDRAGNLAAFAVVGGAERDWAALERLMTSIVHDKLGDLNLDILALQRALLVAEQDHKQLAQRKLVVPVSIMTLIDPDPRDMYLTIIEAAPASLRQRLLPVLVHITPDIRLADTATGLRQLRLLVETIGACFEADSIRRDVMVELNIGLLCILSAGADHPPNDTARSAMSTARHRHVNALILEVSQAEIESWKAAGATLFCASAAQG
jgi:PAS domain S-box-containing protein